MDPFIGQIIMFGGNFAPRGWAICDGQLLAISSNTALFSILGTTYGGDGRTTFGLPDMRGRVSMGEGTGPGLTPKALGAKAGNETATLTTANMPAHNHTATLRGETAIADNGDPTNRMLAFGGGSDTIYADAVAADEVDMHPDSIVVQSAGNGQGFSIEQPYQVVNYIIALQGTFPSRS